MTGSGSQAAEKRGVEAGLRVLLTGAEGRLGRALLRLHSDSGYADSGDSDSGDSGGVKVQLFCPDRRALDLRRTTDVRDWLAEYRPQCIVHTAACTQVDAAEADAAHAMAVNTEATRELAQWAGAHGAGMLYLSTDYVFDGGQSVPYLPQAAPRPLNVYGMTKWLGEQAVRAHCPQHWVLRSSWLHHDVATVRPATEGMQPCFAQTILQRLLDGQAVQVVSDQTGTPTTYTALAQTVWHVLLAGGVSVLPCGTYHAAGAEVMSWHALAQRVADSAWQRSLIPQPVRVQPISTAEWNARLHSAGRPVAQRPVYSALRSDRLRC